MFKSLANSRKIVVIRHGQAEHNILNCFNSKLDSPTSNLTPIGNSQVLQAAEKLTSDGFSSFDHVFVSPLARTLQTLTILAGQISIREIHVDKNLIENQAGIWEGKRMDHYPHDPWNITHGDFEENEEDLRSRLKIFCSEVSS